MNIWKFLTGDIDTAPAKQEAVNFDRAPRGCALCDHAYGGCMRCGHRWNHAKHHTTNYGEGGCFPLCETCWAALTPEARWPYYLKLRDLWMRDAWRVPGEVDKVNSQMPLIEAAVLAGG